MRAVLLLLVMFFRLVSKENWAIYNKKGLQPVSRTSPFLVSNRTKEEEMDSGD